MEKGCSVIKGKLFFSFFSLFLQEKDPGGFCWEKPN